MHDRPLWQATPDQALLLRAALLQGPAAVAAWEAWIGRIDIERLDAGSHRLLPLLYRNLKRHKISHAELPRIKGVYMHTWATNQTALRELGQLVGKLEAADIPTLVLKGAALATRYYRDAGVRPMSDFDILVPDDQVDHALALLATDGWTPQGRTFAQLALPYRRSLHARGFDYPDRALSFDLHWRTTVTHLGEADDLPFWAAAAPMLLGKTQTRTLCPADQLLHLCIHSSIYDGETQMRWLPDALVVLRQTPEMDWARLVAQTKRLDAALVVAPRLRYLHEQWADIIPGAVPLPIIDELAALPIRPQTRRMYDTLATYAWERTYPQLFWLLYGQYLTTRPEGARGLPLLGFLRYMQHRWLVDSPVEMVRGGWARSRERRARRHATTA
jgi:hypothetical protein